MRLLLLKKPQPPEVCIKLARSRQMRTQPPEPLKIRI